MKQMHAVTQWWEGLTTTERHAVLRLPVGNGLPADLALDLAENGVQLQRVNPRIEHAQVLTAFPDSLREHLERVRGGDRAVRDAGDGVAGRAANG
jgi:hypothetical protein